MERANWRTPDFEVTSGVTITLTVPDNPNVKRALMGAIYLLAQPQNWDEVGTATPLIMSVVFQDILANAEIE